jgi:hypothetical protein
MHQRRSGRAKPNESDSRRAVGVVTVPPVVSQNSIGKACNSPVAAGARHRAGEWTDGRGADRRTKIAMETPDRRPRRDREKLRRAARVAVMETAYLGKGNNAAKLRRLDRPRLGCVLPQGQVRARAVLVAEVAGQVPTKMLFAQNDDVVEQLAPYGSDHALGVGVLPRGTSCGEHLVDSQAL